MSKQELQDQIDRLSAVVSILTSRVTALEANAASHAFKVEAGSIATAVVKKSKKAGDANA